MLTVWKKSALHAAADDDDNDYDAATATVLTF